MKKTLLHKILFIGIIGILLIPSLQKELSFLPSKALSGAITKNKEPKFSWSNWWSGDFQKNTELYLKDTIGFHSELVRLHNQIDYSAFGKINANGVIEGKEGYLYGKHYIDSYLGNNFIGKTSIDNKLEKIKNLQDTLAQMNKTLLVVFAAGKGTYLPEFFPKKYDHVEKKISNYEYYTKRSKVKGVNHIDFNKWFVEIKRTTPYPLFPRTGIHWNRYAELLVADSLIHYIEKVRGVDLPEIVSDKLVWHYPPLTKERDMENGMNLIFDLKTDSMPYPRIRYDSNGKTKLNALIVADSYYWGLEKFGFTRNVFENGHFWFYYNTVYPPIYGKSKVKELDVLDEILKRDVVILLATDASLERFPWGFENLYSKLLEPSVPKSPLEQQIEKIYANEKWLSQLRKKAKENKISLEEQVQRDAKYLLEKINNNF